MVKSLLVELASQARESNCLGQQIATIVHIFFCTEAINRLCTAWRLTTDAEFVRDGNLENDLAGMNRTVA